MANESVFLHFTYPTKLDMTYFGLEECTFIRKIGIYFNRKINLATTQMFFNNPVVRALWLGYENFDGYIPFVDSDNFKRICSQATEAELRYVNRFNNKWLNG